MAKFKPVTSPVTYFPIGGTHAWNEDEKLAWWERGSEFTRSLASQNLILHARNPFEWDTSLDGLFYQRKHQIWKAAAKHLACHMERVPLPERNLIAHSHGGNVVFHACGAGLRINNLITVGTPVRSDMEPVIIRAVGNINYWHHICDSHTDFTAIMGTFCDGRVRIKHTFDLADSGTDVKGIGHSKILNEPKSIKLWDYDKQGWVSYLAYGKGALDE